uniref:Glucosidase 2 subunit beta n=1 Tax=Eutreptiella gymnastica TaxID=73025 RepID=A0A7S4FE22_9EUGL
MLQLVAWLLISFCATVDNFETVHGVLQEHQSKYAALEGVFRCFDAMTVIASDKVNDDYCDCKDGSDEPGTAACTAGVGFWCSNEGWRPQHMPSSRVGDGICDCCDGSDEVGMECNNTCAVKAAEQARAEAERRARLAAAHAARLQAVQKGQEALRLRVEHLFTAVPQELARVHYAKDFWLHTVKTQETLERHEKRTKQKQAITQYLPQLKIQNVTDAGLLHIFAFISLEQNEVSAEVALKLLYELLPHHTVDEVELLTSALEPAGAEGHAEAQKQLEEARKAYKKAKGTKSAEEVAQLQAIKEQAKVSATEEKEVLVKTRSGPFLQAFGAPHLPRDQVLTLTMWVAVETNQTSLLLDLVRRERRKGMYKVTPLEVVTHVRPEADQARESLKNQTDRWKEVIEYVRKLEKEYRSEDFGLEEEFYALKGHCFERRQGDHNYKMCPYGSSQQDKRSIGQWNGFHKQTEWHSKYRMMRFTNGDQIGCPRPRESEVMLECGESPAVIKVEEPEVCKYVLTFACPQACVEE